MASTSLAKQAEAIADQYLAQVKPDYYGRFSEIADPDTVSTLLRGFASGLKPADCCEAAGISTRTYHRWTELADANPDSAYGTFVKVLKEAKANGKLRRLEKIEKHGDKEWTALAWINERTDPEQFALRKEDNNVPKVIVQIGAGGGDVKVGVLVTDNSPTFACSTQQVTQEIHRLSEDVGSDNGDYVATEQAATVRVGETKA